MKSDLYAPSSLESFSVGCTKKDPAYVRVSDDPNQEESLAHCTGLFPVCSVIQVGNVNEGHSMEVEVLQSCQLGKAWQHLYLLAMISVS